MSGREKKREKSVVKGQNTVNNKNIHEFLYRYLLKAHVGPDIGKLINEGEAAIDAYHRHQDIIKNLPALRTGEDVIKRIEEYPYYFGQHILKEGDLARIIPNMETVRRYIAAVHKRNRAGELIKPVIESILNLKEEKDFFKFFNSIESFFYFLKTFPQHTSYAVRRVFANNFCLNAIFSSVEKVELFKKEFPQHIKEAKILAGGALKKSESKGVESSHEESQFVELLRRTVGSDPYILINPGETAYDACLRYGDVYFDLQINPVKTLDRFVDVISKYPHCYIDFLVDGRIFKGLFRNMIDLHSFCKIIQQKKLPEAYMFRVIDFIFSLDDDFLAGIFYSGENFFGFLKAFSKEYADRAVLRVFGNDQILMRIFYPLNIVENFIKEFPEYMEFAIDLVQRCRPNTAEDMLELQKIKESLKIAISQQQLAEQKATKNPAVFSESEVLSGSSSSLSSAAGITAQLDKSGRGFNEEAQASNINKNSGKENYQRKEAEETESSESDNSDTSSAGSSRSSLFNAERETSGSSFPMISPPLFSPVPTMFKPQRSSSVSALTELSRVSDEEVASQDLPRSQSWSGPTQ
jgi:hypothetical protein